MVLEGVPFCKNILVFSCAKVGRIPHLYIMSFEQMHKQIFTVGLTGGIGAGKSTVGRVFETLGIPRFDADKYAHKIYSEYDEVIAAVVERFGLEVAIIDEEGNAIDIDRAKLGAIVFENEEDLEFLNELVHPAVSKGFETWLDRIPSNIPYVIREAAILFESGSDKWCSAVINVSSDEAHRIDRVMQRDNCSKNQVVERMNKQLKEHIRIEKSDFVIFNNPKDQILNQVHQVHSEILSHR